MLKGFFFFLIIGQSKELRELLCNPHLRELLESIDSADSKYDAMKVAMQEPLFTEFSDQCLKIVENGKEWLNTKNYFMNYDCWVNVTI